MKDFQLLKITENIKYDNNRTIRSQSSIRINKHNYYNNYLKRDSSSVYIKSNFINLETNKKLKNYGRSYAKKITFRQKFSLNRNISDNTTNYLSKK